MVFSDEILFTYLQDLLYRRFRKLRKSCGFIYHPTEKMYKTRNNEPKDIENKFQFYFRDLSFIGSYFRLHDIKQEPFFFSHKVKDKR